ncbi:MAG TPA: PTS sugar transporter subunit IIB [Candidatus Dormibacteraeota bacterium]|nr:PTS sugar transporter subunit IIB [Candidatus Dormibacteraeota bacterium]
MDRKRRVLVACGTAIATSTHVANRLEREFAARGLDIAITQCRVAEVPSHVGDVDVVVTTAPMAPVDSLPIVSGIPFLTGIGEDEALKQILEAVEGG